jgi:hypothetical protein
LWRASVAQALGQPTKVLLLDPGHVGCYPAYLGCRSFTHLLGSCAGPLPNLLGLHMQVICLTYLGCRSFTRPTWATSLVCTHLSPVPCSKLILVSQSTCQSFLL